MEQIYEYLFDIYKYGGLSKAAAHINVTIPTLSIALKKAESNFGVELFERGSRPMKLTPAGEICIEHIKKMKLEEENLYAKINGLKNTETGSINIGGTQHCIATHLHLLLKTFHQLHPLININLYEYNSFELIKKLNTEKYDVAVCFGNSRSTTGSSFVISYDDILFCVPKALINDPEMLKYAFTSSDIIQNRHYQMPPLPTLEYMRNIPFINLHNSVSDSPRPEFRVFTKYHIPIHYVMSGTQMITGYHYSTVGIAASVTSTEIVRQCGEKPDVLFFRFDDPITNPEPVYALFPHKEYLEPSVQKLMKVCKEYEKNIVNPYIKSN